MKKFLLSLLWLSTLVPAWAQTLDEVRRETLSVPERLGGVQSVQALHRDVSARPPKGYKPFSVSHYGRHGARYVTNALIYERVHDVLETADREGNLTPLGDSLRAMYAAVYPRLTRHNGDLTAVGQAQHRQIAADMLADYPEVFSARPVATARATTVPRCIMSMASFLEEWARRKPDLRVESSAAAAYLPILNPYDLTNPELDAEGARTLRMDPWGRGYERYRATLFDAGAFASRLFLRPEAVRKVCSPLRFAIDLHYVSSLSSSMDFEGSDFSAFYTEDERFAMWEMDNILFYMEEGPGLEGNHRQPLLLWPLLEDFIETAETDVRDGRPSVRLRFGHDMPLMGLLSLMGVEEWSRPAKDWPDVKRVWQNWRIPMASHLEMVLYRNRRSDEVLVKFLLNNEPLALPLEPFDGPYYRWTEVRDHYRKVLSEAREQLARPACNRLFSIENKVDGHPMQAFSIRQDTVYVVNDGGLCRTWSLRDGRQTGQFMLGCAHPTLHGGNADFSTDGLLYVSGDLTTKACYVERVTAAGSEWVQTLTFALDNGYGGSQVVLDRERARIVYMQRENRDIKAPDNRFHLYEFRLPSATEGDLTFTEADVLREYVLDRYEPIYQGGSIHDGLLLLSHGVCPDEDGIVTGISGYDLATGKAVFQVDLSPVMPHEPQSVCVYDGKVYMNFNGKGFYEVVLTGIR